MNTKTYLVSIVGVVLLLASTPVLPPRPAQAQATLDKKQSLEQLVITPFRAQLEQRNQEATAHSKAVDSGAVQITRGPGVAGTGVGVNAFVRDKQPGWVIHAVRLFENDYYTTTYTQYTLGQWEWVDPAKQEQALIPYEETLFLKNADSVEEIPKAPWQKWLTLPHRLKASYENGEWRVEEVENPTPPPGSDVHRPSWKK
jgi:hypothetical protein